jgi:uncharacterized membrane-anchored protein
MRRRRSVFLGWLLLSLSVSGGEKTNRCLEPLLSGVGRWTPGPCVGDLGGVGGIQVPRGFSFLNGEEARRHLAQGRYAPSGQEVGLVARSGTGWYLVLEYDIGGWVSDADWDDFDGEAMLAALRQSVSLGNWERRRPGWTLSKINGWAATPRYDRAAHRLDWALDGWWEGQPGVQFNSRILGRFGVLRSTLIADPSRLSRILPEYRNILTGIEFRPGYEYADRRAGEFEAEGGLTALVVGPAAVGAVRSGVMLWPWKTLLTWGALAACVLFLRVLLRPRPPPPPLRPWYLR